MPSPRVRIAGEVTGSSVSYALLGGGGCLSALVSCHHSYRCINTPNVSSKRGQRRRRWPRIEQTLIRRCVRAAGYLSWRRHGYQSPGMPRAVRAHSVQQSACITLVKTACVLVKPRTTSNRSSSISGGGGRARDAIA